MALTAVMRRVMATPPRIAAEGLARSSATADREAARL
jgi:hypothetical protein